MKKAIWIISAIIIAFIGYGAASPFITISNIKTAVVEQDPQKLSDNIDFQILRQNVKNQVNSAMLKYSPAELQGNPFAVIAAGFATNIVEGAIDSFVTPSGLAMLMEGRRPPMRGSGAGNTSNRDHVKRDDLFKNARYSYDSFSRFSIWVPTDTRGGVRFILQRDGLSWKLVDMVMPF
ncbi:MAG: DUF2939 domain-containing protein [Pseudomonadota bacterium]